MVMILGLSEESFFKLLKIIATNDIFKLIKAGYKKRLGDIKCPVLYAVDGTQNSHRDRLNPGE